MNVKDFQKLDKHRSKHSKEKIQGLLLDLLREHIEGNTARAEKIKAELDKLGWKPEPRVDRQA